ncbi:hypothetical protein BYT27DRAFT_7076875, partial [Phlegmacium glaucopus]
APAIFSFHKHHGFHMEWPWNGHVPYGVHHHSMWIPYGFHMIKVYLFHRESIIIPHGLRYIHDGFHTKIPYGLHTKIPYGFHGLDP